MKLLTRRELLDSLDSTGADSIFLDPLLSDEQVGSVSVDLRLGYDFLVSVLTRAPSIPTFMSRGGARGVASFFRETRREVGETFIVYPGQLALSVSLEYLSLPANVMVDIDPRSSFSRLGLSVSSIIQPGFRGCAPLELHNRGNTPVEVVVGTRICQARFYLLQDENAYLQDDVQRKYFGHIRPVASRVQDDSDIRRLRGVRPL